MAERLPSYPDLAKKIKASFLWRITSDGKVKSEWTTDFTKDPGSVHPGKPSSKPNCTVTIADEDFVKTAMGQTNPQKLFMQGKVKISGNIMLAQKLQTLMKEIDLKQESAKLSKVKLYTILYYTILYYTILYYTILYYTILCYAMLYVLYIYSVASKDGH